MDSTTGSCLLPAAAAAMAGIDTGACIAAAASLTNPFVHSVQVRVARCLKNCLKQLVSVLISKGF
jgi:hypothetical protein